MKILIHQGQADQHAYIVGSGWACSYKMLRGGTRQIVDFQVPGDFLGLRSVLFRTADHSVEPITRVQASEVREQDLLDAFNQTPRLAAAVLWEASRDEAMVVEHLVGLGRRNANENMAHFLLELGARLKLVGLADRQGYVCPLSQYQLADALGNGHVGHKGNRKGKGFWDPAFSAVPPPSSTAPSTGRAPSAHRLAA